MQIEHFNAGDVIFEPGQESDKLYILQQGRVELTSIGGELLDHAGVLSIGTVFGEMGLFKGLPRSEKAVALTEVQVETLTKAQFSQMFGLMPREIQRFVNALVAKTHSAHALHAHAPTATGESSAGMLTLLERMTALLERGQENRTQATQHEPIQILAPDNAPTTTGIDDLGVLQPLLADPTVNDILVNGMQSVYVERHGKLEKTDVTFASNLEVLTLARDIAARVGRKMDPHRPMVDARLLDGSRVNVISPPLAVDGTSISIRKFATNPITLPQMVEQGNASDQIAEFLRIAAQCKLNVLISGGTGAGKTTLLNAISQHIGEHERVVTVEDAAELRLQQPHVVRLETKPLSTRGRIEDEVTTRDLVRNALRMRPDRIIVGEVRGPEAFDMMQAMNTGHEGSMSTIHANHPRDALARLENMVSMTHLHLPSRSIRQQIASALHLVVQISRMRDGVRRITYVSEVVGIEADTITMQDIFVFNVSGEDKKGRLEGAFQWTGIVPRFVRRAAYYGEYAALSKALGVKLPTL